MQSNSGPADAECAVTHACETAVGPRLSHMQTTAAPHQQRSDEHAMHLNCQDLSRTLAVVRVRACKTTLQNCHNKCTHLKQTEAQHRAHPEKLCPSMHPKRMQQSKAVHGHPEDRQARRAPSHTQSSQPAGVGGKAQAKRRTTTAARLAHTKRMQQSKWCTGTRGPASKEWTRRSAAPDVTQRSASRPSGTRLGSTGSDLARLRRELTKCSPARSPQM